MRFLVAVLVVMLGFGAEASAQGSCTGLCLQQLQGSNSCPNGGTTSISGVVYAPNGIDPLPNVTVYVPNAPVPAFTPGVSCPVVGAPPAGQPLVGTTTAVDGSFTITNMPVGTNIPLVIVSGRWRRQVVIPNVASCTNTALPSTSGATPMLAFPQDQTQGDIPKIAIATGSVDAVECVLRKVGIKDSEFTDASGNGRINLFIGDGASGSGGAEVDSQTPKETALMGNAAMLSTYDLLMLPCEGGQFIRSATALANIVAFANAGGRVYSTHYSYAWLYNNPPFNTVAHWAVNQASPLGGNTGVATVNTAFSGAQILSQWLQLVGVTTNPGQMPISTLRQDMNGVIAPTEDWLDLNDPAAGNPVMQMVFDTPVAAAGSGVNQCGRVLFNEYHVESAGAATGQAFPTECSNAAMTPQEKLLEYSLFELTNNGGSATLTPTTQAFGTVAVGFSSAPQTFTWTNNSTFTASVTLLTGSGDFNVTGNNCNGVLGGNSCQITVVYSPTSIGPATGTLTVGSNGSTLTAALTGTGVPAMTLSPASLTFGSVDVGASLTQTMTLSNTAPGTLPVPPLVTTGDYTASTAACGSSLAANTTCGVTITFKPTTTGSRPGTVAIQATGAGAATTLAGNGIDFTITDAPASGTVIAGDPSSTVVTTTPLAGFANPLILTCSTNAAASTCTLSANAFTPTAAVMTNVAITTTSQYTVIGYTGSVGGGGWLSLVGVATGLLLWIRRRSAGKLVRSGLTFVLLAMALGAATIGMSGCSGLLPAKNAVFTTPGTYNYTITATDGFLTHSATYSLTVKSQ